MRETLILQGVLALIGIAFVATGIGYFSTNAPLGVIGAMGGLLMIAGAIQLVLSKKRARDRP